MLHFVRLLLAAFALVAACGLPAMAEEPSLQLRVSAADPSHGTRLAARDTLYLRVSYRSAVPLRFRAKGYIGETEVTDGAAYNTMPVYPAGEHEALVWISYFGPARIDELRISIKDADWTELRTLSYPVTMEWTAGGTQRRSKAAWVATLSDRQQSMTSSAMSQTNESDALGSILVPLAAASIPGYICLQLFMLYGFSGSWRIAAGLPLIGMIPLALYTLAALAMGSNLWPLMALFLTPPAFLYLLGLLLVRLLFRAFAPS